jgi:chitin synthase
MLALLTIYLVGASIVCAVQAAKQGGAANSVMVFSIVITYGGEKLLTVFQQYSDLSFLVYLFASVLAFDVWHMFTSFVPYLLLSPTYINVLNM